MVQLWVKGIDDRVRMLGPGPRPRRLLFARDRERTPVTMQGLDVPWQLSGDVAGARLSRDRVMIDEELRETPRRILR